MKSMPLDRRKPYRLYRAPFHPPLYEQPPDSGRFFYPDGCEVPLENAVRMLCYLRPIVQKYGKDFGVRWRPELIMHGVEQLTYDQRHEQEEFYRRRYTGLPSPQRGEKDEPVSPALEEAGL